MNQVAEIKGSSTESVAKDQLESLRRFTKVVADTGDFSTLKQYSPEDATTNPSLILKAAQMPAYKHLVDRVIRDSANAPGKQDARLSGMMDNLLISFGVEILKIVPGRVSTETDASLSFDTPGLVEKARTLIGLYQSAGIPRERVLIKIASTWEGIRAAEVLQREGINCNMTLLFSLSQAVACADAQVRLISPFVGRILDWHTAKTGSKFHASEDPGVLSVKDIFTYYKKFGYPTEVMGASFRNKEEILELAGCDALTISPNLLRELQQSRGEVEQKLDVETAKRADVPKIQLDEKAFRWLMNEDAMATEKLAEGIRLFEADARKLKQYLVERS